MRWMDEVELLVTGQPLGTTLRDICPKCGGGMEREKSLSVTLDEDGWLLWHCFRASCGLRGRRLMWGVVHGHQPSAKKLPQGFSGALVGLPDPVLGWFWDKFGLGEKVLDDLRWKYAPERDRIYIPVSGPRGQYRGCILREWKNKLTPRNLVYKELRDEPFMYWLRDEGGGPPVIVEDAISAAKVWASGASAISLGGTHLSAHMVREILNYHNEAYLALDKDAYAKSVAYAGTFRGLIGLKLWKLEKDLKYEKEERIREAYYGEATDFSRP